VHVSEEERMSEPSPDLFERLSRGMRAAYSKVAEHVPDVQRMDREERASAEMTTYALALAYAAEECGFSPPDTLKLVISCINDLRRIRGEAEVVLAPLPRGARA
jgi:hypothetical protein